MIEYNKGSYWVVLHESILICGDSQNQYKNCIPRSNDSKSLKQVSCLLIFVLNYCKQIIIQNVSHTQVQCISTRSMSTVSLSQVLENRGYNYCHLSPCNCQSNTHHQTYSKSYLGYKYP